MKKRIRGAFLSHLANDRDVTASTQNQALCALLFLYRHVLDIDLPLLEGVERAKRSKRIPVVLTREQVRQVLANLEGTQRLVASLQYGSGLRLMESVRLRFNDLNFNYPQIVVRDGKGRKDRVTVLLEPLIPLLHDHLERVRVIYRQDLADGHGRVKLPHALRRKYRSAARAWGWQFVFPARTLARETDDGVLRRHHLHHRSTQRAVKLGGYRAAGQLPYLSALLCQAPAGKRLRHSHRARAYGACRRAHHHDLYPRDEPWGGRRDQPAGWLKPGRLEGFAGIPF